MSSTHDTLRLLREVARELVSAQLRLEDTLPGPDDLDEWLEDWDIPQEHHAMFRRLSIAADEAFSNVDQFERLVREEINKLVPQEKS